MDISTDRPLVDCDDDCGAFSDPDPDDIDELRNTLTHWRDHGWLCGCSHGC